MFDPTQLNYEGIVLNANDFTAGKDNAEQHDAGTRAVIGVTEIGEDGQLSSFEALRLGDSTDPEDPAQGRIFMVPRDGNGNRVDDSVKFRFRLRDKNGNMFKPATQWYTTRDLDKDRPDHRRVMRPRTKDGGKAWYFKRGREVVLEAVDETGSFTVDINDSLVEVPARGGS